jgi:hypothetical protein
MSQQRSESTSPEETAAGQADVIRVLGLEDTDPERPDRSLKRPQDWRLARADVPVDVFRQRVIDFLDSMRTIIADLPQACGGYELDQVTVSAEISAKGQVSLLGSGGELAGKAGLTFLFTKKETEKGGHLPRSAPSPGDDGGQEAAELTRAQVADLRRRDRGVQECEWGLR